VGSTVEPEGFKRTELVWNYGTHMLCKSGAEDRKIKSGEKLTKCLCGDSESLPSGELADRLSGYCRRRQDGAFGAAGCGLRGGSCGGSGNE
jgi:hypothetical protein